MGNFRIEIDAVGGHGCDRQVKDGGKVYGCGHRNCPDCEARAFVKFLQAQGFTVNSAKLTHWPDSPGEVQDDLVTRIRKGSF